ncbi:MAG: hypothetical protein IKW58_03895 [Alphaproteobacteria bacterium]|nr:hypothetical protein [Alphaproteobacteria bacterium]
MLEEILYMLPEISLVLGILHLCILHLLSYESPKVYAKVARIWLQVSLFCLIVFYDRSISIFYFDNNSFTLLFKVLLILFSYQLLIMSSAWFSAENQTGIKYLILIFLSLIASNYLISSINIISFIISYTILISINYFLLNISSQEVSRRYMFVFSLILFLMLGSFSYIYITSNNLTQYKELSLFFSHTNNDFKLYISAIGLLLPLLFSLGIVPFHAVKEEEIAKSILPVSHYFAVIMPLVFWSALIKYKEVLAFAYKDNLMQSLEIISILSIIYGAIGANSRINLHRIYTHGSIYHFGVILMLLSFFNQHSTFSAFLYLLLYVLTLNGLYSVFYNLKSQGEFLSAQISLSGLAQTRPHTTRALLISIFSLLGFPPFAGFLAEFSFINVFLQYEKYLFLSIILVFFLILAKSYLEIVKTAYFEQKIKSYDTENKTVQLITLIGIMLIISISFNPFGIIEKLKDMFYVIYL